MSEWRDVMREVARRTEPTPAMVARARAGVAQRSVRRWSWSGPVAAAAVAVVAAGGWVATRPAPEPVPVRVDLASGVDRIGGIAVEAAGLGEAVGVGDAWSIDWTQGRIALDLPADSEHTVELRTPEAVIRVVGTALEVERTALGTRVAASAGRVDVGCLSGGDHEVLAGGAVTCLPVTATGLLGRARALGDAGATPDVVLAALDAGLALAADNVVRAELQAQRIAPLSAAGRLEEALAAAESVVAGGGPRADQVRHAAAALAWSIGGCERARPHLVAIVDPTDGERAWLASCP